MTNEELSDQIQSLKLKRKNLLDEYGELQYRFKLIEKNKLLTWIEKGFKFMR
ncbi:hypothetical protein [Amphibacillus indicireducens]|uniref:Uncharacterized protein n=1 Tax=Amphibacillus indicireducens TaxID=1076330 RepID=A0ABP7VLC9_9BACI